MEQRQAIFTFYGNLKDFLPSAKKGKPWPYNFTGKPSVKDAIEAIGIPHSEVGQIKVNGTPISFQEPLTHGALVEVFAAADFPLKGYPLALHPPLPVPIGFVVDMHLGKLARWLRLLGFDTLYNTHFTDKQIAQLSLSEQRVVLTRDVGLLKHKTIQWGYWLRLQIPVKQLQEVWQRYQLATHEQPFTRCMACNHFLMAVSKESVMDHLPPKTKLYFEEFYQCTGCQKVYWKGSHYEKMLAFVQKICLP
ncbi:hypothetical protein TH61_15530 [Rufibacter sp. DG15C]|uniref:Mut7-C RNAse domain-containing protein n=1 Tax=Rufibacter sp. DG15C TaxID=1379909 RepID=UPI00078D63E2|nr:Mut7-C RNAse domain-containing protein [Rufibacter sp. DG15C]AMM52316.1 hypothetical protein TH61_15530 [Rufibacter sp. DG15C]